MGKTWSPTDVAARLGNYSVLGPAAAANIPDCTLVQFPDFGHAPLLEDPDGFHEALFGWLSWQS